MKKKLGLQLLAAACALWKPHMYLVLEAEAEMWIQCPTLHFPRNALSCALGFSLVLWLFRCLSYSMSFLFKKGELATGNGLLWSVCSVCFGLSWAGNYFGRC